MSLTLAEPTPAERTIDPRRPTAEGRLVPAETLRALSRRSDRRGAVQTALHFGALGGGAGLIAAAGDSLWIWPAMVIHGVFVAALFGALHESVHYTTFRTRWLNVALAWIAGAAIFTNGEVYRVYHYAHHRYTQDPQRDPELGRPKPATLGDYLIRLSGFHYWLDRASAAWDAARADFSRMPYVPAGERGRVTASVRAMLALYGAIAAASIATGSAAALTYWVLPGLLGYPALRAVLLAEHTGCTHDANGLTNTRTTLTSWPVRLLYWNLPYHAEHHLYPSLPFHALPSAHRVIRGRLGALSPGYISWHRDLIRSFMAR